MAKLSERSPRKTLLVLVVFFLSAGIGFGLMRFMGSVTSFRERISEGSSLQEESQEESEEESQEVSTDASDEFELRPGWKSYSGIIEVAYQGPSSASHSLVDAEGNLLIYLTASDQKLDVSESLEAEVQGPVSRLGDGDGNLMSVERVIIR